MMTIIVKEGRTEEGREEENEEEKEQRASFTDRLPARRTTGEPVILLLLLFVPGNVLYASFTYGWRSRASCVCVLGMIAGVSAPLYRRPLGGVPVLRWLLARRRFRAADLSLFV